MAYLCEKCGWSCNFKVNVPACPKCKAREAGITKHPRVARNERLISWLVFYGKYFRPQDKGLGDTAHWLCMKSCNHPDTFKELERLLTMCACKREDAIVRLNEQYPY